MSNTLRVCCCSEMVIDVIVKSDYLVQEIEKEMGQRSLFLPCLRRITQIQIDIIINVSFDPLRVADFSAHPSRATEEFSQNN